MKIKLSESFKLWLGVVFIMTPLMEILFYYLMQVKNAHGVIEVEPHRPMFLWLFAIMIPCCVTFILLVMELDKRNYQKDKIKSGEATPYFEKNYFNGTVRAYNDTIKLYQGSRQLTITYGEFMALSQAIQSAHDNRAAVQPMDLIQEADRTFNDGHEC